MVERIATYLMPLIGFIIGGFFIGYARKFTARIQNRVGPPIEQFFYDVGKTLSKVRNISHGGMFDVSVMMAVAGQMLSIYFVPIFGLKMFAFNGDLFVLMYMLVIGSLGMALGAGEAANPNASIGISRALSIMVGYEVPFVISVIAVMSLAKSTSLINIIAYQNGGIAHWNMINLPLIFIASLIALQGKLNEKPFEVTVAPHEIATGPLVEFGGKYMGFLQINHALHIFVELALIVDLFLGGGNFVVFVLKMLAVFTFVLIINAVYPRYKTDGAIKVFLKWPTILAALNLIWILYFK